MSTYLTNEMFKKNVKTRFWLVDPSLEAYALDLVECVDVYSTPRQEQFSLRFRGDPGQVFPQRTYLMKHDSIGDFELFLVPIARDDSGTHYEAVFDRLAEVSQADGELQHQQQAE
jgi:hypothetical protein